MTYNNYIGKKVRKITDRPFKSGNKINTVKSVVINTLDPKNRLAYMFEEDDSIVNCDCCEVIE